MTRPDREDLEALRVLLGREDLSDVHAEFVDSLRNWVGYWTPKQGAFFDVVWDKYYGQ